MATIAAPATDVPTSKRRPSRLRLLVVAVLVGLLAPLLTTATADAAVHQRNNSESLFGSAVLTLINTERAAHHIAPVHMNKQLMASARSHNVTMAGYNTMSHQLPNEAVFTRRMTHAGYKWTWAGENIAWNSSMTQSGVLLLETLMYNEKAPNNGHRLNILNPHFQDVGVDIYLDTVHHKVWLTTDFGRK